MPRSNRISPGGMVFHVRNRGVRRQRLFDKAADYEAFESIIEETLAKQPMRICSYCLMPNHWHFVHWPEHDDHLAAFIQRLTVTHVTRWQKHRRRVGEGHVYQGRFKSFPVETDDYFYQAGRYAERNALRANLVSNCQTIGIGILNTSPRATSQARCNVTIGDTEHRTPALNTSIDEPGTEKITTSTKLKTQREMSGAPPQPHGPPSVQSHTLHDVLAAVFD